MARIVKDPDERKNELLDIASKLIIEKGYENTSVKDIYTGADGSFGMFYHHFKSKEEVLEEVNKRMTAQRFEEIETIILDNNSTGIDKLRKILALSISSATQGASDSFMPLYQKNPHLLALHMRDTLGVASDLLFHVIEDGIKDGTIQVAYPNELSQMILLFLNVWINPWIYTWTSDELRNIFVFMKDLFEKMGIPAFTEDMFRGFDELHSLVREEY